MRKRLVIGISSSTAIALTLIACGASGSNGPTEINDESNQDTVLIVEDTLPTTPPCGLENGDIIFQTSTSGQALAIQYATHSKYSHVGMILFQGADTMVIEAVQPVKITPFRKFVRRGTGGHYVVKRLKQGAPDEAMLQKMKATGEKFVGKNYDLQFEWDDDEYYCSELVYKLYQATGITLCELRPLKDYDLESVEVMRKLAERYGINVPMDQEMVSPGDIFDSELLIEVEQKCD